METLVGTSLREPTAKLAKAVVLVSFEDTAPDAPPPGPPKAKPKKPKRGKGGTKAKAAAAAAAEALAAVSAPAALAETDDYASAWEDVQERGGTWGGRGQGGRGAVRMGAGAKDVYVENLTLAFPGRELLRPTLLRIVHSRRYVLLGRNGVGKSSLLRRIASGGVPGFPQHLGVALVAQDQPVPANPDLSALDDFVFSNGAATRSALLAERDALEAALDGGGGDAAAERLGDGDRGSGEDEDVACAAAERLGELEDALDELNDDRLHRRCAAVLKSTGFSDALLAQPVGSLSGGYRMRAAIARALLARPDILLLDEPSNHLDLEGLLWLEGFLTSDAAPPTVVFVTHDRAFATACATDCVVLEDFGLRYHRGGLADYEQSQAEAVTRQGHLLDAQARGVKAAASAAQNMQASARGTKKGADQKKQKQAKQKLAKVERLGLYREDGKRYKTNSLAKLGEKYARVPTRVEAKRQAKADKFDLGTPNWLDLRLTKAGRTAAPLVTLDKAAVGYDSTGSTVLDGVTACVAARSRIAVVGENGAGKSTLLRLLSGELVPTAGEVRRHPQLRVAHVRQHHAEALFAHRGVSAAAHCVATFACTDLEARAKLGKVGVTGAVSLLPMRSLSGGQQARVSLALLLWDDPHVILLDEPTNHLDMSAIDALAEALRTFDGAAVVVSHNRGFCAAFCRELWVVGKGTVTAHSGSADLGDEADCGGADAGFAALFADYAAAAVGAPAPRKKPSAAAAATRPKKTTGRGGTKASPAARTGLF